MDVTLPIVTSAETDEVACPCCGDDMDLRNVVCWPCWRASKKLTPGTYVDPDNLGETFSILAEDVAYWQALRAVRQTAAARAAARATKEGRP